MMASPYGYGPYHNSFSAGPSSPFGTPLTPALSSTLSDDSYKTFPSKLSPYIAHASPDLRRLSQDTSDPRRLSVESLLSGPPGMPDQQNRGRPTSDPQTPRPSSAGNGETLEEMRTWGVDRGFKDLDVGKNDDANAISGGSPIVMRDHLELSITEEGDYVPVEFGFGVQSKDTAFEKNDYYAQ